MASTLQSYLSKAEKTQPKIKIKLQNIVSVTINSVWSVLHFEVERQ